jgi:hypothetical protein
MDAGHKLWCLIPRARNGNLLITISNAQKVVISYLYHKFSRAPVIADQQIFAFLGRESIMCNIWTFLCGHD